MVSDLAAQSVKPIDYALMRRLATEHGDGGYAEFVTRMPFEYYLQRVQELGFVGMERVIDVGCGYGQWAAALAMFNRHVVAMERHEKRLSIVKSLTDAAGLSNVEPCLADALSIPYPAETFDAVLCYGVLMFIDRGKGLAEFRRILKPGGRLYVCVNGFGWWLQTFLKNMFANRHVRYSALVGMLDRDGTSVPKCTNIRDVRGILEARGFELVRAAPEGTIAFGEKQSRVSAYPPTFMGFDNVIEFVASTNGEASSLIDGLVEQTLARTTYCYLEPLRRHAMPKPALDLVTNCDMRSLRRAVSVSSGIDRVAALRRIFARLTAGCTSDLQKVARCLRFAQVHFYHHFAGQPVQSKTLTVFDPLVNLQLGFSRCGNVATFLADLFLCNGLPARTIGAACHTSAEVLCDGKWTLADASLYPSGIHPQDELGKPLSLEQAIARPELLDRVPCYINYHHEHISAFLAEYPEADAPIGFFLRNPILPSSAFFGRTFFRGERMPGVQRMTKRGSQSDWNKDEHFGWLDYSVENLPITPCDTRFRPPQVNGVGRDGEYLAWGPVGGEQPQLAIRYRLTVSPRSRGWSYPAIPVDCTFTAPGHEIVVDQPRVKLDALQACGNFLTISAMVADWPEDIFYLPSVEFDLAALP